VLCTHCNINWVQIPSQDEGEDSYYYCPKCKDDFNLVEDGEGKYIMNPFTGEVVDIYTRKPLVKKVEYAAPVEKKPFDINEWAEKKDRRAKQEEEAIAEYIKLYSSNKNEAEKAFFNKLNHASN
jgi:hypothetical protein